MALGTALPTRLPFSSGGSTYYVDGTNGSDTVGTGSSGSPWKTINKALSTVPLTGSIIIVKAGTYTSSGSSYVLQWSRAGNTSNPVTIKAETPGAVTIAAPSGNTTSTLGAWCVGSSGLRIQDITFSVRGGSVASSCGILIQNSSWIELYRCTFVNSGGAHIQWRGGEGTPSTNLWLYACTLGPCGLDCTGGYFDVKGTHHAYLGQYQSTSSVRSGVETSVVANNVFYGRAPGRHVQLGPQFRNGFVVNNTFYGNTGTASTDSGGGVEFFNENSTWTTSGNIVKNNIFSTMRGHGAYGSTFSPGLTGNIVAKNLAYNLTNAADGIADDFPANYAGNSNWPLFAETGGQIASANPLFTNPTGGDFSLQTGSPAAGVAELEYAPTEDFNGTARSASAPSVGAFEANSVPETPTSSTHIGGFTVGATQHQPAGDIKTATKWNVASTVYVDRLEAYVDGLGSGTGTANIRIGIYSDSAGSPSSLIVSSSPIAIADGQAAGWVTSDIATTQITSGDKWFAVITDSATVRIYGGTPGASGIEKYNSDTYSDGFASTFGATSNETGTLNIRARVLQAPENTIVPSVGGTVVEGDTLTVNPATWSGTPTFTYQWRRGTTSTASAHSNISGQTSATYVITTADIGYYISCNVTATNAAGSDTVSSTAVGPVTALPIEPPVVDGGGSGLSLQPAVRGSLTLTPAEQA